MQNDAEVAHAVAASLQVDVSVIEVAIMEHDGDLDTAMEVCAILCVCICACASVHAFPIMCARGIHVCACWGACTSLLQIAKPACEVLLHCTCNSILSCSLL